MKGRTAVITLVGVGHVFALNRRLRSLVLGLQPQAVAVELDWGRYHLLRQRERAPQSQERGPPGPLLFWALERFQQHVAGHYGTEVGSEMLAAANAAAEVGAKLVCIDRDVLDVVDQVERELSWRERFRLFWSMAIALVRRGSTVEDELQKYQDDDLGYLAQFGDEFPTLKRILIDERNDHMAAELEELADNFRHTLAVVGDGHVPGLRQLLRSRGYDVQVVRLAELRSRTATRTAPATIAIEAVPPPWSGGEVAPAQVATDESEVSSTASVSFSFGQEDGGSP